MDIWFIFFIYLFEQKNCKKLIKTVKVLFLMLLWNYKSFYFLNVMNKNIQVCAFAISFIILLHKKFMLLGC